MIEPSFILWASDQDAAETLLALAQRKRDQARGLMTQNDRTKLLWSALALERKAGEFQEYAKEQASVAQG